MLGVRSNRRRTERHGDTLGQAGGAACVHQPSVHARAGDGSVDAAFSVGGATVWGTRYFTMWYEISATNLGNCPFV